MLERARKKTFWNPYRIVLAYFVGLILAGTLLLMLPLATADGQSPTPLAAFFTSTSAACVTGLVVVDTGSYWSVFGQIVILGLIELGGLGFASSSVLILLFLHRRLSLNDRLTLRSAVGTINRRGAVRLSLFILKVTLIVQAVGAIFLFIGWVGDLGVGKAAWWAVFHSISSFANAGFDIAGTKEQPFVSMVGYANNTIVNLTLAVLIILGGIGFVVIAEVLDYPQSRKLSIHTRLVLIGTAALLFGGAFFIWFDERDNPLTLGTLAFPQQIVAAFFHSASPRTAGMNTINLAGLYTPSYLLIVLLMFIGGGSGSTAGGLKVSTLMVILAGLRSVILGRPAVVIFGRTIPSRTIQQAMAIGFFYTASIAIFTLILTISENVPLRWLIFEVVSAFCTVGLSLGATLQLTAFGQVLIALAMFVGRLGPILLVLALARRQINYLRVKYPEEDVAIG